MDEVGSVDGVGSVGVLMGLVVLGLVVLGCGWGWLWSSVDWVVPVQLLITIQINHHPNLISLEAVDDT